MVAVSVVGTATAQDSRSDWQYMKGGEVPENVFRAIHNRCSQIGANAYQSTFNSGLNLSSGLSGGLAGLNNALSNLQTIFKSEAAQNGGFNDCMAQHGFYPR